MNKMKKLGNEYESTIETLEEISMDTSNLEYMTRSAIKAYNFDKVKGEYTRKLSRTENGISSADALWINNRYNRLIFIEFKNGKNCSGPEIRNKMRDSLLIYCDIADEHISDTRFDAEYVVVYNKEKRPIRDNESTYEQSCNVVQKSDSRDLIKEYFLGKKAKTELVRWGIDKYLGIYFNAVHTYDKEQFETYLEEMVE